MISGSQWSYPINYKRYIAFGGRQEKGMEERKKGRRKEWKKDADASWIAEFLGTHKKICLASLICVVIDDYLEENKWFVNLKYSKLPVSMQL